MKKFNPKQVVQMALDTDSFEPGPVEVLSLRFEPPYAASINTICSAAKSHGGSLSAQSRDGSTFRFPSLKSTLAWFKEVTGREPLMYREGDHLMIRRPDQFISELPAFALLVSPA